jgi:predicted phage tail protein
MLKNWKTALAAAALSTSMFAAGAVYTTGAHAQTVAPTMRPTWMRGENRSNYNIRRERRRLENVIDHLQHDQRDYGGHRVSAINLLVQARAQLDQAIQYDNAHPGQ